MALWGVVCEVHGANAAYRCGWFGSDGQLATFGTYGEACCKAVEIEQSLNQSPHSKVQYRYAPAALPPYPTTNGGAASADVL